MEENAAGTSLFVEIRPSDDSENSSPALPAYVDAYVTCVEPQQCGPLVKRLSQEVPLKQQESIDLSHLKRVKRVSLSEEGSVVDCQKDDGDSSSPNKRRRTTAAQSIRLEVLLGEASFLDTKFSSESERKDSLEEIKKRYNLSSNIHKLSLPARPPDSEQEWNEFQSVWPTTYFPNKTREFREQELRLNDNDIAGMCRGMEEAIRDAMEQQQQQQQQQHQQTAASPPVGAVVVAPESGLVVSRSSEERRLQNLVDNDRRNPLSTNIILAIQGVSRRERDAAIQQGMDSTSFQSGQYLCTGYDLYATEEPSVYEAMALVHSRIRRLVFGYATKEQQPQQAGITVTSVHALPGTNHKYRAFQCRTGSDLWKRCDGLRTESSTPTG